MILPSLKALRLALEPAECFLFSTQRILYFLLVASSGLHSCSPANQNETELSSVVKRQIVDSIYPETTNRPMEILLIIGDNASEEVQQQINELTVLQEISPQVKVVEGSTETAEALAQLSGVSVLTEESWNKTLVQSLTEEERLFVEAWRLKQQMDTKKRPGEGASWDDPNFQPPDSLPN